MLSTGDVSSTSTTSFYRHFESPTPISDSNGNYNDLFQSLKTKDIKKMRRWVVNNIDLEPASIYRGIYDSMEAKVSPNSIPQLVLILADYQYKNAFVVDHELNMVACLTECMKCGVHIMDMYVVKMVRRRKSTSLVFTLHWNNNHFW